MGNNGNSKKVVAEGVCYESFCAAARALGVSDNMIRRRIAEGKEGYVSNSEIHIWKADKKNIEEKRKKLKKYCIGYDGHFPTYGIYNCFDYTEKHYEYRYCGKPIFPGMKGYEIGLCSNCLRLSKVDMTVYRACAICKRSIKGLADETIVRPVCDYCKRNEEFSVSSYNETRSSRPRLRRRKGEHRKQYKARRERANLIKYRQYGICSCGRIITKKLYTHNIYPSVSGYGRMHGFHGIKGYCEVCSEYGTTRRIMIDRSLSKNKKMEREESKRKLLSVRQENKNAASSYGKDVSGEYAKTLKMKIEKRQNKIKNHLKDLDITFFHALAMASANEKPSS
jgi:hypothetical protein